ncbi:MAG TPA: nuclear transport factor 2 family protein [Bordetella sp.]|nr:nuclear transport factor 2 family protein [Bordetella sp.]
MTTDEMSANQVAGCVEKLRLAMLEPTQSGLDALAAQELSYGHSNGMVEDKASFIDALVSQRSDFRRIDLTGQTITLAGDVALVRHTLDADTFDGGRPGHVTLKILLVWQKRNDAWKLLARQAVRLAA